MTTEFIIEITRTTLMTAALLSAPVLLTALVIGVLISLFQAVTQINEATLTFIPKIIAVGAVFMLLMPWMVGKMEWFMIYIFSNLTRFVR